MKVTYSDAAKRISDSMNMHALAGSKFSWAAYRMSDGTPVDNSAYDSREAAVKAAGWDRDTTVYLEIQPDGMTPEIAEACLGFQRSLYAAGFRLPDPNFSFDLSLPKHKADQYKFIRHMASGGREFPQGY